jgi:Protein of unknown function (DUF819)
MEFNEAITKNVEVLEQRARTIAQDEMSRAQALDQKTAGLIAAALVLVAAAVAFASHLNEISAGTGARTLWGVLIVVVLLLLLASLAFATAVMHPQPFRVAIHKDELDRWATPRFLDRDPTRVLGELMQASVSGAEDRAPGSQGIFGVPFDVVSLVENIGLDADTNTNLTRRMLLLLESCEATGSCHDDARRIVLDRYMNYGVKDFRPPRFLLNDLTRYWRTICVDFEGKHADSLGDDPKWVSRNAKLRISRKLLFAGGLVPILLCHLHDRDALTNFLDRWLRAVPLDRLATAFDWAGAQSEGARALTAYDRWMAIQLDPTARAELKTLRHDTRRESALFQEIMGIGAQFERAIIALLFNTRLAPLSQQYLVF